jgi:hypothetical protein
LAPRPACRGRGRDGRYRRHRGARRAMASLSSVSRLHLLSLSLVSQQPVLLRLVLLFR